MFKDLVGSTDPNRAGALTDYKITVKTGDFRKGNLKIKIELKKRKYSKGIK